MDTNVNLPEGPRPGIFAGASREMLLHQLYEAAELEHNLMCTYLYAAFSLKSGVEEGLSAREADAPRALAPEIMAVAVDEMSHLAAVWNITSALGGTPRFGRTNLSPLDVGHLPASGRREAGPFQCPGVAAFHLSGARLGEALRRSGTGKDLSRSGRLRGVSAAAVA